MKKNENKQYTFTEKINYYTDRILEDSVLATESDSPYELIYHVRQAYLKSKRLESLIAKEGKNMIKREK